MIDEFVKGFEDGAGARWHIAIAKVLGRLLKVAASTAIVVLVLRLMDVQV